MNRVVTSQPWSSFCRSAELRLARASQRHPTTAFHRFAAVLGVALVVLLNVLAVSPKLHAWIHSYADSAASSVGAGDHPLAPASPADSSHHPASDRRGDTDHECAVTLFAGGISLLLFFHLPRLSRPLAHGFVLRDLDWLTAARPRYWHVPAHAPPQV